MFPDFERLGRRAETLAERLEAMLARAEGVLGRVESLLPPPEPEPDWTTVVAARWRKRGGRGFLHAVAHPHAIGLADLVAVDAQKQAIDAQHAPVRRAACRRTTCC